MLTLEVYLTCTQAVTFEEAAPSPTNLRLLFQLPHHPQIEDCSLHQDLSHERSALRL